MFLGGKPPSILTVFCAEALYELCLLEGSMGLSVLLR